MKLKLVPILTPVWILTAVLPSLAQGAYITTVTNFVVSPVGHEDRMINVTKSEQGNRNGFSLSSDSQGESSTTTNQRSGGTTTTISNNGTVEGSITKERGRYSKTESFEFSESFDYADFVNTNTVTSGFNGETGPRRRR